MKCGAYAIIPDVLHRNWINGKHRVSLHSTRLPDQKGRLILTVCVGPDGRYGEGKEERRLHI